MNEKDQEVPARPESEESFEELLNRSGIEPVRLSPGQKVTSRVIQIAGEWVFIDVGGKTDGCISLSEFIDDEGAVAVKEGDSVVAHFLSSRNGELWFTTRLTADRAGTEHLQEAWRSRIPVEGQVEKEIKGGFEVRIPGNVRGFCPYSQMGLQRVENGETAIGRRLTFQITEFREKGRNVILSHRAVLEEERRRRKDVLKGSLREGMTVAGRITSIRKFGAFADIGGVEGLIPISEMSWGRMEDVKGSFSVGQSVDVTIKKLDWENDRYSFSLKDTLPDPWNDAEKRYPEGSIHKGKVARLAPYGAFVSLEPGVDGLLHVSELAQGRRIRHAREALEENQELVVKIARVDKEERRLSLLMVPDGADGGDGDDYGRHTAPNGRRSSGSLGTLGDLLSKQRKNGEEHVRRGKRHP